LIKIPIVELGWPGGSTVIYNVSAVSKIHNKCYGPNIGSTKTL